MRNEEETSNYRDRCAVRCRRSSVKQSRVAFQLAWLKEHEKEIVKWIHSKYPKVETIQFEWDTLEVLPVSNGVQTIRYNLSVKGTFNNIPETVIVIDFRMKAKDDVPSMKHITMNNKPSILREGTLYYYE